MDLSVSYLGLSLSSPIIVGSSGLTDSAEKIIELEKKGAVVKELLAGTNAVQVVSALYEQVQFMKYFSDRK